MGGVAFLAWIEGTRALPGGTRRHPDSECLGMMVAMAGLAGEAVDEERGELSQMGDFGSVEARQARRGSP